MSTNSKQRVDPRITRTKKLFKEAMISLLQENDDKSKVTVQKLANRAELNRATFYLHYQDIEDLMEQMVNEVLEELSGKINPVFGDHENTGTLPIVSFLEHIYDHAVLFQVMLENKDFRRKLFNILVEIISIRREIKKGSGTSVKVPIEIVASSTFGIVTWWIQSGTPYSPIYLADQINLLYRKNINAQGNTVKKG
ncbi:TetR/AcrR family transcriptional regulator [Mesobacillus maritimus]|uniref:TetR/AcrR family transcriptional regulator n=1 Tax=Mesobacillus maritimus TaxID=1643336 RepID=A0ABS7K8F8_9BACI|nr:TetR/AcrR family transcriptional regulator [Mesobacillus maritimus]MBY0098541.1 TetR/AcrR family transcriptional regulator [Mesobacillus maritimus]